jgi:hypothetical protein
MGGAIEDKCVGGSVEQSLAVVESMRMRERNGGDELICLPRPAVFPCLLLPIHDAASKG